MAGTPAGRYVQQDFLLIPLLNLVAEPVAGSVTPSAANVGKFYRNTVSGRLEYVLNATTAVSLPYAGAIGDADIAAAANIQLSKLATNPLARSNHTGTQLAATISDLITTVTALRLDQFAQPTTALNINGQKISNAADAAANTDLTTLQQVNNLLSAAVNGQDWKNAVKVAVTTNVNVASPGASLDGIALTAGDRVLLTAQSTGAQNGLYVWNGSATAMTRATDADVSAEVTSGMSIPIEQGTHAASIAILTTPDPIVLGTTTLTFTYLANASSYVQGTGITITGNTISLNVPVTVALGGTGATTAAGARTNLGAPQIGFAQDIPALTAGVAQNVVHNLGTLDVHIEVYRKSDGASADIGLSRVDINTVSVIADVAVAAAALRVVIIPIA
jgi:hypothetical protein